MVIGIIIAMKIGRVVLITMMTPNTPNPRRISAPKVNGILPSTRSMSLANLLTILPFGFVSKNDIGAPRTDCTMLS